MSSTRGHGPRWARAGSSLLAGGLSGLDAWRFAARRADYYDYLQAVLRGSQGRLTIRELFDRDAQRHGANTVRGRLSVLWARRCEAGGGDLHATWLGCFPRDELALIRTVQAHGNARLLAAFAALARHLALLGQARDLLWETLAVAALALLLLSALLPAMAWWTVPSLQQAFSGLPPAYLGDWSRALFALAQTLRRWGFLLCPVAFALLVAAWHAMPRTHGPWRVRLDRHGPWKLYRQVQAMRFLALVAILLVPESGQSSQLRPVIVVFLEEASPWLARHLREMVWRIDQGLTSAAAFDTGLLDPDLYWYFEDMVAAQGLQQGLQVVHERMAGRWLQRMRAQAQMLRWAILLAGVAVVMGLGLWHYAVIDELRRGWMMFHAVA
ncbi:hypothetical protein [Castellaniella sp.]|uniref:hypothetical protein n=1 Tax=Castellaniella sp. TaxID=1955812 RepID=UPI00356093A7